MSNTELTKEQEALIDVYVDIFRKKGLSTKQTDLATIEPMIRELYSSIGQTKLKHIILVDSPVEVLRAYAVYKAYYDKVPASAEKNTDVYEKMKGFIKQVVGATHDVFITDVMREEAKRQTSGFCYGSFDAGWLSYYLYFKEVLNVKGIDNIQPLVDLCGEVSYYLPCEEVVFVSRNPVEIHVKGNNLHCETGPSIRYADGYKTYSLNGVSVPEWLVETPAATLPAKDVMALVDVSQRREGIRKMGPNAIFEQLGGTTLSVSGEGTPNEYRLIELNLGNDTKGKYLRMTNQSIGCVHIEGVTDDCMTVIDALKFRNQAILSVVGDGTSWIPPKFLT